MNAEELRRSIVRLRDSLSPAERRQKSELIAQRLPDLPEFKGAGQALFYMPIKSEVDTRPMLELAQKRGMDVAVPRVHQGSGRLIFYELGQGGGMKSGSYGILEPEANSETMADFEVPTVVVVPGLVFDTQANRLGWGKGHYDRFFAGEGKGLARVGIAFDCQIVESVPVQAWDVPMDVVLTESRILRRSS